MCYFWGAVRIAQKARERGDVASCLDLHFLEGVGTRSACPMSRSSADAAEASNHYQERLLGCQ